MDVVELINKYGFPIVAAGGMGYFIYYVWGWVTTDIKPVISEANKVLIDLIDRLRMLDNDLIRLNQKLNVVLMLREKYGMMKATSRLHGTQYPSQDLDHSASAPDTAQSTSDNNLSSVPQKKK